MPNSSLFARDAVYVSDAVDRDSVFSDVYQHLLKAGYVKGNFLSHVLEREDQYPTGIDTSPISKDLPNVAIPHTEGEFVNARLIVPVALKHPIKFKNMVDPSQELDVKFWFMILNMVVYENKNNRNSRKYYDWAGRPLSQQKKDK